MPENFLAAMGPLGDPGQAFRQGMADQMGLQQAGLNQQIGQQNLATSQFNLQKAQTDQANEQARLQAYQQDVAGFIKQPTAEGAANLALKHPDFDKQIKDSWAIRDKSVQDADRQGLATVYSSIANKRPELAQSYLESRLAADQAAGKSEPLVQGLLDALKADPTGKSAQGISAYMLSAIPGGDDFAKTLTAIGPDGKTHVINPGGSLVDDQGNELYHSADRSNYKVVTGADGVPHVLQVGGDDASHSAGTGAGRYTGGWTPRARNGGDNPDNVVDNKIAGAAKFLGVDPSADVGKLDPKLIAQAMTLSEGGAGSLADRNNNPANIKNSDGTFKKFPTKEAGLNAAAALVARKLRNGQTTVQSLIEGVPDGGDSRSSDGGVKDVTPASLKGGDSSGGVAGLTAEALDAASDQGILTKNGGVPPGRWTPAQRVAIQNAIGHKVAIAGGIQNAIQQTQLNHARGKALDGMLGGQNANVIRSFNTSIDHLATLGAAADALGNGNLTMFNKLGNALSAATGSEAPTDFNATKAIVSTEVAKVISAGHLTDKAVSDVQAGINSASSPAQLKGYIRQLMILIGGQLHNFKRQYATTTGRDDFEQFLSPAASRIVGSLDGQGGSQQQQQAAPVKTAVNPQTGQRIYYVNGRWQAHP